MKNLILEYPSWSILLCPVLGLIFATILYYRDKRLYDLSNGMRFFLAAVRFAAVSIIAFFLLEPLVRQFKTELEQPVLVVAVDNSTSLVLSKDSSENKAAIDELRKQVTEELEGDFETVFYSFGQEVTRNGELDFDQPITDISALFQSLKDRYSNRNLGGVVLASDGIYNRGSNPRYALGGLNVPVYTLALGDTTIRKDALIAEAAANRLAFLGNNFPIEVRVRADRYKGATLSCSLIQDGAVIDQKKIPVQSEMFEGTLRFLVEAKKPGLQRYTLSLGAMDDEITLANNRASVVVDVIDSRQKVLLLAHAPHPDLFALRRAIESSDNYEVDVAFQSDFNSSDLEEYDIHVLHQLPSLRTSEALQIAINKSDKPIFAIVGGQTIVKRMPSMGLGVQLNARRGSFNDVNGVLNPSFSKFSLDRSINEFLGQAPPLQVPFGNWSISNSAEIVFNQKVGNIDTEDPLLLVNEINEEKNAILLGEGIWRWRLYDYAVNESHSQFDGLITSLIQFLAVKEDKRFFRVQGPRDLMENEPIIFNAELYNASYEAVNDAEASMEIRDGEGKTYPFNFSRTDKAYRLDAGTLPVGTYSYTAEVTRAGKQYTDRGNFSIQPFELEGANLRANHQLLYNISENSGGELVYSNNISTAIKAFKNSERATPVSYSTEILSSLLNLGWPLFLIILLLATEWFIRKRTGHY